MMGCFKNYVRPTLLLNSKLARCLGYSHFERTPMMLHHFAPPLWVDPHKTIPLLYSRCMKDENVGTSPRCP